MRKIIISILIFAIFLSPVTAKSYQFLDHEIIEGKCIGMYNPPTAHPQLKIDAGEGQYPRYFVIRVSEHQFQNTEPGIYYRFEEQHGVTGKSTYRMSEMHISEITEFN